MTRPVGRSPDGIVEPWRISSHVHADGEAAKLQQVEFQYGPDERAIKFKGDATLSFGPKPELVATLSASQIDLDRILALPEAAGRRPLSAIKTLAESFVRAPRLPVAVSLGFSVETVTLAGAMLQRVGADLKSDGDGWNIENFALRVPGLTQVAFSGRLGAAPGGVAFNGATRIESADPRALIAWLGDHGTAQAAMPGPLRLTGDIALGPDRIAFDRLRAELDRTRIEGHLDYAWPSGDQPAKLNAALRASELDLDRAQSLLLASLGEPPEWPLQGTLALDIGRATAAGVEAKDIAVKMRRDPGALDIERFVIGDFGGAKLTLGGRIDTHESAPRGSLTLDLDARSLDGMAALIGKFSAPVAERIRRAASRSVPVKLHTTLMLEKDAAGASATLAKLKLLGSAGVLRLDLQGEAGGSDLALADLTRLGSRKIRLTGLIDASDGGALVDMLGLERLVAVNQRSGRLTLALSGPLDGDLAVNGALLAGGLDVSATGTMHPAGDRGPTAQLALKAAAANLVPLPLRSATAQRTAPPPWSTLRARLTLGDSTVTLADIDGTLAGIGIKGELGIAMTQPTRMTGDITVATLDLPAAIGATIGFPRPNGNGSAWPADPFETGLLGDVSGQITLKAAQAALTSRLTARDLRAILNFNQSELKVADLDGMLAGGRVVGDFGFERGEEGVTAHSHLRVSDADAAELLGNGTARAPLSGKLTAAIELSGSGRSPIALIGSLAGAGTFALAGGQHRALRSGGVRCRDPRGRSGTSDRRHADRRSHGDRAGDQRAAGLAGRGIDRRRHGTIAPRRSGGARQGRRAGAGGQHRSHPERHRCAFDLLGAQSRRPGCRQPSGYLGQPEGADRRAQAHARCRCARQLAGDARGRPEVKARRCAGAGRARACGRCGRDHWKPVGTRSERYATGAAARAPRLGREPGHRSHHEPDRAAAPASNNSGSGGSDHRRAGAAAARAATHRRAGSDVPAADRHPSNAAAAWAARIGGAGCRSRKASEAGNSVCRDRSSHPGRKSATAPRRQCA